MATPLMKNAKKRNMLAVTDSKEPSLVVSYLPNLTSASQPMNGAKSDETNSDVVTNVGEKTPLVSCWYREKLNSITQASSRSILLLQQAPSDLLHHCFQYL